LCASQLSKGKLVMKLYHAPGACSLAVHIALREAGQAFDLHKVNLVTHRLADGSDYRAINPRGYVPLLELDDGSRHTEAAALLQYVGDLDPTHRLLPSSGRERLAVVEQLAFVATELHKVFSPWLWHADTAETTKQAARDKLAQRFAELDRLFADHDWLALERFTVADAYAFTIVNWANFLHIDLLPTPNLRAYLERVAARPAVQAALAAEGLDK
jgi:glutathione S-transferase